MDIIGGAMFGAGLVLVIKNPEQQWHYMLGSAIAILVIPRVLESLMGAIRALRAKAA